MFKKGQLAKTNRGKRYVIVLLDENEYDDDNLVEKRKWVRLKRQFNAHRQQF